MAWGVPTKEQGVVETRDASRAPFNRTYTYSLLNPSGGNVSSTLYTCSPGTRAHVRYILLGHVTTAGGATVRSDLISFWSPGVPVNYNFLAFASSVFSDNHGHNIMFVCGGGGQPSAGITGAYPAGTTYYNEVIPMPEITLSSNDWIRLDSWQCTDTDILKIVITIDEETVK
jgi:hypothetical protein